MNPFGSLARSIQPHLSGPSRAIRNNRPRIDASTGNVIDQYTLPEIKRASGLAWDGRAMWISEFDGKIWRLPF